MAGQSQYPVSMLFAVPASHPVIVRPRGSYPCQGYVRNSGPAGPGCMSSAPQSDCLGEFLKSRRNAVTPAAAGISNRGERRRVPGLRREELAQLAGVSVAYYVRLEQGQAHNASDEVLFSIARALCLSQTETAHSPGAGPPAVADDAGISRNPTGSALGPRQRKRPPTGKTQSQVRGRLTCVREGGLELTSTPSRRESRRSVLPHKINDLRHVTCG